jgi:hypothetical protein
MVNEKAFGKLNDEISKLRIEYAKLKNKPKPFETEAEKEARETQFEKDKHEKYAGFEALGGDFEKKRDYVLSLGKEVEVLRMKERKDELEQKLKDQTVTDKELLELQALNSILQKT